ncbi:DUF664 domain-containing protein [Paenibacillus albus]|uniref:DUF664 domain-containing protein n=1 Tax=Paenibacillus albus TaxID=2495582 RepID=A0A3Q8XCB3_9BACL|nr:DUF664 domain-containing protein [Paenibacillus albus]
MTTIDGFIQGWLSHRKVLEEMLADVTTEQLSYKPWDSAMSLSGLVLHMTSAMGMFASTVKNGAYVPGTKRQPVATIEELRAGVAEDTKQTEAILRTITAEELEREIEFFGNKATGAKLLQNGKEHEIHHKGQLFIYLRIVGIEKLPFYVSRG